MVSVIHIVNMTYHIVLFIKENSVEAVPSHWLSSDGKTCAWPKRHLDPIRQIEKKKQPNTLEYTWFQIRILAKSICKYTYFINNNYYLYNYY